MNWGVKRTERRVLRDPLARNIRLMRADCGWWQEVLGAEAGLNRTCLSAVEPSKQNISLDSVWTIALAFGALASR